MNSIFSEYDFYSLKSRTFGWWLSKIFFFRNKFMTNITVWQRDLVLEAGKTQFSNKSWPSGKTFIPGSNWTRGKETVENHRQMSQTWKLWKFTTATIIGITKKNLIKEKYRLDGRKDLLHSEGTSCRGLLLISKVLFRHSLVFSLSYS